MNELRERNAAKDDSNEACKHQVMSLKTEIDSTNRRMDHQKEVISQRDEDIASLETTT